MNSGNRFNFSTSVIALFRLSALIALTFNQATFSTEQFSLNSKVTSTRDKLTLRDYELQWRNKRSNFFWPYAMEEFSGSDYGFDVAKRDGSAGTSLFTGYEAGIHSGHYLTPNLYTSANLELDHVENKSANSKHQFLNGQWNAFWRLPERFYLHFQLRKDVVYEKMFFPKASEQFMREFGPTARLLWIPLTDLRFSSRLEQLKFSDDNKRSYADFDIKTRIGTRDQWYWLGIGSEYYRYAKDMLGYWTPRQFKSFGLRSELVHSFTQDWKASWGLNLHRFRDENRRWGDGYYSNLAVEYGKREELGLKLGHERIQSVQSGSKWYNDTIYLQALFSY